eukprot:5182650-Pleurochrysis_carterae.AAC.1
MGHEQLRPTAMHIDNSGAVELSKERRSCQCSQQVDRRALTVLEYVEHGLIDVRKIHTSENIFDVFRSPRLCPQPCTTDMCRQHEALYTDVACYCFHHSRAESFPARGVLSDCLQTKRSL